MKRILLAVTNDLSTDNRVHKISCTLLKSGAMVTVIGRKKPDSIPLEYRPYKTKRFRLLFKKGPCFYIEYNIRLFFYILFRRFDIVVANDLDTLLASFLASKIKSVTLIYDSHEYFTQVPELQGRNNTRRVWEFIERKILPKVKFAYTVSESIASEYQKLYGINMRVVRNLPFYIDSKTNTKTEINSIFQIIYQGSLNMGRGLEHIIDSMQFLKNVKLTIIGDGDIANQLKERILKLNLSKKIELKSKMPFKELIEETHKADLGISLEENMGLNYYYALPNKLFDYIQAGVPVLVSNFPEMTNIVTKYEVGTVYIHKNPKALAEKIQQIILHKDQYEKWRLNTTAAAKELCWEKEENIITNIFTDAGLKF